MKSILFLTLAVFFFSCSGKKIKTDKEVTNSKVLKSINNNIIIDTSEITKNPKKIKNWSAINDYYGVYQFSKNITGIGFEIVEGNNMSLLDSLIKDGISKTDTIDKNMVLDKTGNYNILFSKKLSQSILKNDTSREFFIYCTKGLTKAKIEQVLYGTTDCTSVLILKLSKIDTQVYGYPVIASKKRYNLLYKVNPDFQKGLENYQNILNKKSDYKDSIISKQFAFNSNLYLAYSDDFKWFATNNRSKCLFPSRMVLTIKGKSAKVDWVDDLDLFGIPCD